MCDGAELVLEEEDDLDEASMVCATRGALPMAYGSTSSFSKKSKSTGLSLPQGVFARAGVGAPSSSPLGSPILETSSASPRNEKRVAISSSPSQSTRSEGLHLELREVEVQKLHKLDVANQSFQATIWVEFAIPKGALDQDLCAGHADRPPTQHFPINPRTGIPTFRPSATWYMAQIDCRNALNWRMVDGKVMKRGEDLIMAVRLEGSWVEVFELTDYPFDSQGLTCTMVFNCRAYGPMPVDITVAKDCKIALTCMQLCPPIKEYRLHPVLYIRPHLVGTGDRIFPGVSFTCKVARHPFYHVIFAAIPMGIFSLLSVLTTAGRRVDSLSHRAHLSMILLLTASTYRIAAGRGLPAINYLTMLDRYNLGNASIIVLCALLSRIQHIRFGEFSDMDKMDVGLKVSLQSIEADAEYTGTADLIAIGLMATFWLVLQVFFGTLAYIRKRNPRIFDVSLKDPKNSTPAQVDCF